MAYSQLPPAWVDRTANDGLTVGNTLILNSTGKKTPVALSKELKGGVHFVEYLEYLDENEFRGVTIGRREEGMIAYVQKHWNNGADTKIGRYYKLATLHADGSAVWEELPFGGSSLTPNRVFATATVAERDALTPDPALVEGDIVVVADASGDTSVVPALTGGATYIRTAAGGWLRFLYPEDPEDAWRHQQNTDTALHSKQADGSVKIIQVKTIEDHMSDPHIHFRLRDLATDEDAATNETLSARKIYDLISAIVGWQPKTDGDGTTFLNDQGNYVEVQTKIKRIDGGTASTVWTF